MIVVTANKSIHFHPKIRRRLDYTFFLKETNEKEMNKIWNNLGRKVFNDLKEFTKMLDQMTDNYGSMVFKRIKSNHEVYRYNAVYKIKLE